MPARSPRAHGATLAAFGAALIVAACAGGPSVPTAQPTAPITTPMASPNATVDAARSAVAGRLAAAGLALETTARRYRPSTPAVLQGAAHGLYRIAGADRNQGWVVIYDVGSADAAAAAADEFARYLGTFGRTNYPADAQFTINRVGAALVFNWWSRSRAADAEPLQAAFDAIAAVGQRYEVVG